MGWTKGRIIMVSLTYSRFVIYSKIFGYHFWFTLVSFLLPKFHGPEQQKEEEIKVVPDNLMDSRGVTLLSRHSKSLIRCWSSPVPASENRLLVKKRVMWSSEINCTMYIWTFNMVTQQWEIISDPVQKNGPRTMPCDTNMESETKRDIDQLLYDPLIPKWS